MKIAVVIPTYNEAGNIEKLLGRVFGAAEGMGEVHVLVVDDNSPDGTADIVRRLQPEYEQLHLLSGTKQGLGAAYVRGFAHVLDTLAPDYVVQMDADFSHDPDEIPAMVAKLESGFDVVLGSRYVKGGAIPSNWGLYRIANSMFGNWVARWLAGMYRIRDCTTGFRAIRADLLRQVDLLNLGVQGYAFQVAMLHEFVTHEARIYEHPIVFIDRTEGESKLGLSDVLEFIANAWWIRMSSMRRFLKFATVGASGVVVNLGSFQVLLWMGMTKYLASPVAIEISILSNFFWNHRWTFAYARGEGRTVVKALKFNVVSLGALVVSFSFFLLFSHFFPMWNPLVHQASGILPAMLINYFLNAYWTFGSGD